jgi:SpoVK/Ycf46/Vps4 family AAA+-type ATPase
MTYCTGTQVVLGESEFVWALEDFTPSSLRSLSLLPPGDLTWADVGGLHDVRTVLEQTFLWPVKVMLLLSLLSYFCHFGSSSSSHSLFRHVT